jgi:hypothetical protein
MTITREIPKQPELTRQLPIDVISLINEILFDVDDELREPCEALLIFGSSFPENHIHIRNAFGAAYEFLKPPKVFITGGVTRSGFIPESRAIMNAIREDAYPEVEFVLDPTSTNTRDNVLEAIKLGLGGCKNILFIAKAPHCGRCKLTLTKLLPSTIVRHWGYDPIVLPNQPHFRKHDWHLVPELTRLAWGELLRIETYGKRGDISFPKELEEKIFKVHQLVANE